MDSPPATTVGSGGYWFDPMAWLARHKTYLKEDFVASIVVFLVALPLCLGIANASEVPATAGIVTGIIGGLLVGLITGAPLQVSGPAAGLIVIVVEMVKSFRENFREMNEIAAADMESLDAVTQANMTAYVLTGVGLCVLLAGIIQFAAGGFKLGQWFRAVSPAVIEGMLAGIGVLIFASQFHVMLDDSSKGKGIDNLITIPRAIYDGIFPLDGSDHEMAAVTGLLTILVIVLWTRFAPKKLSFLPAALVAVIVGTLFAETLGHLGPSKLKVPDNFFTSLVLPSATWGTMLTSTTTLQIIVLTPW